jgi:TonB family protein
MGLFKIANRVAILLFFLTVSVSAFPQQLNNRSGNLNAPSEYPDSPDGLKSFLQDALRAQEAGDQARLSSALSNLAIPDHDEWFVKVFGEVEGRRMGAKYNELLPDMPKSFSKMLKYALDGNRTVVEVSVFQNAADSKATLMKALTDAMVQPIHLYDANGTSPSQKYGLILGNYVYVEGTFRYMDTNVYLALSTAPPLRIREGGNVALTSLTYKVAPIYPDDAKAKRIQGTVLLHVILSIDGAVKDLEVVSGDPSLANAATAAVRQWKYKPTLLNGKPVEVDTTVKVDFTL